MIESWNLCGMRCLDFGGDVECDMEEECNREEGVSYIFFHASHSLNFPNFPRHSRECSTMMLTALGRTRYALHSHVLRQYATD